MAGEAIERTNVGKDAQLIFVQLRAALEIIERSERSFLSFGEEAFGTAIAQAEPNGIVRFNNAIPIGERDADRTKLEAMALAIFDQRCGRVKAHRLIVQKAGVKFGRIVRFEVS